MLHDIDFAHDATPHFFFAKLVDGVMTVPPLPFGERGFGSRE
jgi:CRISPR-associated protein Cas5d